MNNNSLRHSRSRRQQPQKFHIRLLPSRDSCT
jgi:hypothetical protein